MKLQLKKGFLLPEHLIAMQKTSSDYEWCLTATNGEKIIHKEYTKSSFVETVSRGESMLGKKKGKEVIQMVYLFGDPKKATLEYQGNFQPNKDPSIRGTHYMTLAILVI